MTQANSMVLIPLRFSTTILHFMAMLLATSDLSNRSSASSSTNSGIFIIAYFAFFIDFVTMLCGLSLFDSNMNLCQILFHFVGGVLVAMHTAYKWQPTLLWTIVGISNVPLVLMEVWNLTRIFLYERRLFYRGKK